ncbi:Lysosomal Pro-X carboxypeptidase [Sesamum angolense]|uniref:Lysosomal Pro-X carboxypeptidase n=1 Tax=Sesamum angolense TaxID=2727404 RepID=A0AAE2BSW0_9LAMI|nr:Lysosomal Pro-X carboxypeptidase [Sesamum angolense]
MAIWLLPLLFLHLFSSSAVTTAKSIRHGFPSSIIQPEQRILSSKTSHELYEEKFFTQILDHFNYNPQSYETFQQRYLINDTYWGGGADKNAPIFVYTGNEGDIEWFAQNTGFMFEIAPHFKALLLFIEHRYYGKSMPFGGSKERAYANSSTLGYLSATQALADYATLILDLKKNLSAIDSPVVVFGGSYGGMLAAWFRLKYPHVAVGALASSAPILNFDNITSPFSFNDIITQDFRSESESCYKVIKRSWQEIDDTAAKPGGLEILRKSFRICKNYISADDLKGWLGTAYTYAAMTDYPTPTNFLAPLPAYPVKQMCKAIDDPKTGNNTFEKLYGAANVYYNYTGDATCFDLIDDSDPHGLGGWTWQNIYRVLKQFGSNIIFFNGLRDPWSGGGVLKDISKSLVAIVAKEGAHHVDLRFSTSEDPKWLEDVRKREVGIIWKWLSQYYRTLAHSSHYDNN